MGSTKKKGTNFLVQGSILAMASIISRIIGLIYRIPMTEIIGDLGNDYYGTAFEIYNIMLIISSYSLPTAVSKLVSASVAKKERKNAYQILKGSLLFAGVTGTVAALVVYFGAGFFTNLLKTPYSIFALKVLAPALIVVAVLGVIRGFFQGMGTMMPSAISQVLEQIVNAVVSVWAAYVLFSRGAKVGAILGDKEHYSAAYGAAGGTLGTNLGSVVALLFVLFVFAIYMTVFKRQMKREKKVKVSPFHYTLKILIATIIPILLSTTIYNISGIIDQAVFKNIASLQGYTQDEIGIWWGVYSGKYKTLINVPISIASALAASSVPALTASFAENNMESVRAQINTAMRFIMVIAMPCTVGLAVLATPIFTILFPSTVSTVGLVNTMMMIGAVAVVFYSISTLSNGLLQGINQLKAPLIHAAISLVAHVVLLVILMMFFRLNIYAVVIANAFFAFMVCVLNALSLRKHSGYKQEVVRTFLIPALCSGIMGVVTLLVYKGLYAASKSMIVALAVAVVVAVIVYAVSLLLLKGLTEEELQKFPKGNLIIRVAKKLHLL